MTGSYSLILLITLLASWLLFPCTQPPAQAAGTSYTEKKHDTREKTDKVNINTAGAKELTRVKGIGPKTAKRIIAFRRKNGKFRTLRGLLGVKGIGEKKLKKFEPFISI